MDIEVNRIVRKIAIVIGLIFFAALAAYWGVQRTTPFQIAEAYTLNSQDVARLGSPVVARLRFFGYSMRVSDTNGSAEFAFSVRGVNGTAIFHVRLKKEFGKWSVIDSQVIQD